MVDSGSFAKNVYDFSNDTFRVVKSSFGPNGLDCMVSTTSGTLLVTNNGFQILKSLCSPSPNISPAGRLVFRGLESFYKSTGDFSKKFSLLTRELLFEVMDVFQFAQATPRQDFVAIAQEMDCVLVNVFPKLLSELTKLNIVIDITEDIEKTALSIIRTNLNGKFSPKTCEQLTNILRKILFENQTKIDLLELKSKTAMLVDKFTEIFWEVPGRPLSSSAVLPGIVIPRPFVTLLKQLPSKSTGSSFKFIVLCASLGYDLPKTKTVLMLNESQKVKAMLQWRSRFIEGFIQQFVNNGVALIISSKTLHETVIHCCNQSGLAAIESVLQEDIQRLCAIFRINPLFELELQEDWSYFIGEASLCKSIGVGQHAYVHLEPAKVLTKQVLLYAPSQPMCRQYSVALQNALKSLRNAFQDQKTGVPSLSVVSGGGVFELGLALALERYRVENKVKGKVELACHILEKALLSIPRQLLENSGRGTSVCNVYARARQSLTSGKKLLGINKNGTLSELVREGVLEPVLGNYEMVSSVVQLFAQIMKTDQVIHVRKLPRNNELENNHDDSEHVSF